jgi:hypothetical protein
MFNENQAFPRYLKYSRITIICSYSNSEQSALIALGMLLQETQAGLLGPIKVKPLWNIHNIENWAVEGSKAVFDGSSAFGGSAAFGAASSDFVDDMARCDLPCMLCDLARIASEFGAAVISYRSMANFTNPGSLFGLPPRKTVWLLHVFGESAGIVRLICKERNGSIQCAIYEAGAKKTAQLFAYGKNGVVSSLQKGVFILKEGV